jgi:uncharacterized membrane protein
MVKQDPITHLMVVEAVEAVEDISVVAVATMEMETLVVVLALSDKAVLKMVSFLVEYQTDNQHIASMALVAKQLLEHTQVAMV